MNKIDDVYKQCMDDVVLYEIFDKYNLNSDFLKNQNYLNYILKYLESKKSECLFEPIKNCKLLFKGMRPKISYLNGNLYLTYEQCNHAIFENKNVFWKKKFIFSNFELDDENIQKVDKKFFSKSYNQIFGKIVKNLNGTSKKGVFISGKSGSKKTLFLKQIAIRFAKDTKHKNLENIKIYFDTFSSIVSNLKQNFKNYKNNEINIDLIKKVGILFIDDLSSEKFTLWSNSVLLEILNYRSENNLLTYISSNLNLQILEENHLAQFWGKTVYESEFEEIQINKIFLRIKKLCDIFEINN